MSEPRIDPPRQPRYAPRPEGADIVIDVVPQSSVVQGSVIQGSQSVDPSREHHPAVAKAISGVLTVQRPIVLAHLRRMRAKHPHATPAELISKLEKHYLTTVMTGGAGVGVAAAVPAVGTIAAIALASAETIGFIEATALYAHAVAEVHGLVLVDRDRAQALILTLMLGDEGAALLRQLTGQVAGGVTQGALWGDLVTKAMPKSLVSPAVDQLRSMFLKKLAKSGAASVVGKVLPYGVGAVIGGTGNRILGRRIVNTAHRAFGPAPLFFPEHLAAVPPKVPGKVLRADRKVLRAENKEARIAARELTKLRSAQLGAPEEPGQPR